MTPLKDKVAWITGAGGGIGEASAKALAHSGAHVVLSGRRAARPRPHRWMWWMRKRPKRFAMM